MASAATPQPDSLRTASVSATHFVARQTILTADQKVFGYELLFRDGVENFFGNADADEASRNTLSTTTLMGLDLLCDGRLAFINCTRDVLLKDYITLLPPKQVVVEVLETVPPDELVIAACKRLKQAGYMIALDDFAFNDRRESLTDLANIIKVDVRATSPTQAVAMVQRYSSRCQMLAEKVESPDEFAAATKAGFTYFQGYFFRRPEIMSTREIPASRINYLRMLKAVSRSEVNLPEIEQLLKSEAAICYRLLRYMNSVTFAFASEIRSIHHALSILGERELRRWIRLVATLGAAQGKTTDLVLATLVRARFCELLSPRIANHNSDLFLMGMLSLMDSVLDMPMQKVLENIPIDQESKAVLLGEGGALRPFYQLMLAQESGEWEAVAELSRQLQLQESDVSKAHWDAMHWAKQVTGS